MLVATLAWGGAAGANTFGLQLLASGLTNPVALANAGDGSNRLFIVDQTGIIRIYNGTHVLATPFLNITSKVLSGGERGLLGLTLMRTTPRMASSTFITLANRREISRSPVSS